MTTYLVHLPPTARPGSTEGLERAVLVKEGMHWLALFFPVLWLLYHRAWLALLAFLAAATAVLVTARLADLPDDTLVAGLTLLGAALAVSGADVRSFALRRRGLALADVVSGESEEQALRRFLDRWIGGQSTAPAAPERVAPARRPAVSSADAPVLGLFPDAGRP